MESPILLVADGRRDIRFSYDDIMKYHGPGFPGGVAHGFKVMERAFPLFEASGRIERRALSVRTAFGGPGARDAFEMVTRAVTEGRYVVDRDLARTGRGPILQGYYFELACRERMLRLQIRPGHVREEFITLGRRTDRSPEDDARLAFLKQEMADRLMRLPAAEVYEVVA